MFQLVGYPTTSSGPFFQVKEKISFLAYSLNSSFKRPRITQPCTVKQDYLKNRYALLVPNFSGPNSHPE